jgi:hypothetical protein
VAVVGAGDSHIFFACGQYIGYSFIAFVLAFFVTTQLASRL